MKTKELFGLVILCLPLLVATSACQTVKSSELKTTQAEDLRISARVYEYKDSQSSLTTAQMQTLESHVGISLDQGETLIAASDTEDGPSGNVYLSNAFIFNLDRYYDGYVPKTTSNGNYYVTYTDKDGTATKASFATGTVSDIVSPASGATVSGDELTVTWNPSKMNGTASIYISWSGGATSGASSKNCENTGSCLIDISHMSGTGKMELRNTLKYETMPGFGAADISMINVSKTSIAFSSVTPGKSANAAPSEITATAEDLLLKCERYCEEGETATFTINGAEYSCCIED